MSMSVRLIFSTFGSLLKGDEFNGNALLYMIARIFHIFVIVFSCSMAGNRVWQSLAVKFI